ncbi:MAG: UDP-N-acetylglucosamine 2-epimerase (hydrolyzing) [Candidatus Taylorbacteria bacterium]|nr:UDP-N-acetylglucosamine 2-epimerase (hydrolyzing) [Candidatus Taylorbacteria bacterium]
MKKRKILFITERRADYSRLKPILTLARRSPKLTVQLLVTGSHLLKGFGETKKVIEGDGFSIDATVPMFSEHDRDDGASMVKGMGRALIGMADVIERLRPDIVFCGFDLGAHLAAAIAAMHMNIHVAHIQGGEVSGTIDEILRHATTKFAHVHFVATPQSRERIIKLGEDPRYVFLVGSPSLDTMRSISYPSKAEIAKRYGFDPEQKVIVFSQHPVTTEIGNVTQHIRASVDAVRHIAKKHRAAVIAIYSNTDAGGRRIITYLKRSGFRVFPHIVYEDFLRLLNVADVLVGNSSTGIHEAPFFHLPTVNIGSRQQRRERGANVLDVTNTQGAIRKAIEKALCDEAFRKHVRAGTNPYDQGETAKKVVHILETVRLPDIQKVITY